LACAFGWSDAPPFFAIHGTQDPMVSVLQARGFVEQLRGVSTSPVAYADLPGAQHNFDRFASIRCAAVIDSIEAFAAWVRSVRV
jgi:acetyl esterase/lipase